MQKQQRGGQPGVVVSAALHLICAVAMLKIAVLDNRDVYHPVDIKWSLQVYIDDPLGARNSIKTVPSTIIQSGIENRVESLPMYCNYLVIGSRNVVVDGRGEVTMAFLSGRKQLGSLFFELISGKDDLSIADEVLSDRYPGICSGLIPLGRTVYVESEPLNRLPSYGRCEIPFIGLLMVMDVYMVCCVQGGIINFRLGQRGYKFWPSPKSVGGKCGCW